MKSTAFSDRSLLTNQNHHQLIIMHHIIIRQLTQKTMNKGADEAPKKLNFY